VLGDAVGGLVILMVLTVGLGAAVGKWREGTAVLAESEEAMRVAERVLTKLQRGQGLGEVGEDDRVEIAMRLLEEGAGDLAGWRWVRVSVTVEGRRAQVIGVVPAGAIGGVK
jgi:hypothetical protein